MPGSGNHVRLAAASTALACGAAAGAAGAAGAAPARAAQAVPASQARPAPRFRPAPRAGPAPRFRSAPRAGSASQAAPAPRFRSAPRTGPAPRFRPALRAAPASQAAPASRGEPAIRAEPATSVAFPGRASASWYTGLAIDVPCTAPSADQLRAWLSSPYRAIGVSISGINRICPEPSLTRDWVAAVSAQGWRIFPLDQGLQAPCSPIVQDQKMSWQTATAKAQGRAAATGAANAAGGLGMFPGSTIYMDMESYPPGTACRLAVLSFLSGWTLGLHARGYLAGVYSGNASGTRHLSDAYFSGSYARPDAAWNAWYTSGGSLTGWPGVPDARWPGHQRIRQYSIFRYEGHGGVYLTIDNDNADAPVATVAHPRTVTSAGSVSARRGPGMAYPATATYQRGALVEVICQAPGRPGIWDKLSTGAYLSSRDLAVPPGTGDHAPLARCRYPYQVAANGGATLRAGPAPARPRTGRLPGGALAWIVCQQAGPAVRGTRIWDKISAREWVSDAYVATPGVTWFSKPVPRC